MHLAGSGRLSFPKVETTTPSFPHTLLQCDLTTVYQEMWSTSLPRGLVTALTNRVWRVRQVTLKPGSQDPAPLLFCWDTHSWSPEPPGETSDHPEVAML